MRKNKRARACNISTKVRIEVKKRDGNYCVGCGIYCSSGIELAHIVSRAKGGLGIPENLITLGNPFVCDCHRNYDHGDREQRAVMREKFEQYLNNIYPDRKEEDLIYSKWREV